MSAMEWLDYPSEFRIEREEEGDTSEPNILIGSEKNDVTYTKWNCTFVVNKPTGEFFMVEGIKFGWDSIDDYPDNSPNFNLQTLEGTPLNKFKHMFDEDGKLKEWDSKKTIRQNLKQLLLLL